MNDQKQVTRYIWYNRETHLHKAIVNFFIEVASGLRPTITAIAHMEDAGGFITRRLYPVVWDLEELYGASIDRLIRLWIAEQSTIHDYIVAQIGEIYAVMSSPIVYPKLKLPIVVIPTAAMEDVLALSTPSGGSPESAGRGLLPPMEHLKEMFGISVYYTPSRDFFILRAEKDGSTITLWTPTRFPKVYSVRAADKDVRVVVTRELSLIDAGGGWRLTFLKPAKTWYMASGAFPDPGAIFVWDCVFVYPRESASSILVPIRDQRVEPDNRFHIVGAKIEMEIPDNPLMWGWRSGYYCPEGCAIKATHDGSTIYSTQEPVVVRFLSGVRDWQLNRDTELKEV